MTLSRVKRLTTRSRKEPAGGMGGGAITATLPLATRNYLATRNAEIVVL
jgi:hypothetical protein